MPRANTPRGRSLAIVLMFLMAILLLNVREANACTCAGPNPVCRSFWSTTTVFVADVIAIDDLPRPAMTIENMQRPETVLALESRRVRMRVREVFRGSVTTETEVYTGIGGGDCGYSFAVGGSYLVFAHARQDNQLATGICSNTQPLAAAAQDLGYLRVLATSNPTGARIFGIAEFWDDDESGTGGSTSRSRYRGATIRASGRAGRFSATSREDGSFEILVPPGEYDLEVAVERGKFASPGFTHVTLPDTRACAESPIAVHSDGQIAGRLLDSRLRPVPHLTIDVAATRALALRFFSPRHRVTTAADGTFVIRELPPGEFRLGLNLRRQSQPVPYPRVVLGAGENTSSITITSGERVDIRDVQLPAGVEVGYVAGIVRSDDEATVAGARVYLEAENDRSFVAEPVTVGDDGRFSFTAIAPYRYRVVADQTRLNASGRRSVVRSDAIDVTTGSRNSPLVLLLKSRR